MTENVQTILKKFRKVQKRWPANTYDELGYFKFYSKYSLANEIKAHELSLEEKQELISLFEENYISALNHKTKTFEVAEPMFMAYQLGAAVSVLSNKDDNSKLDKLVTSLLYEDIAGGFTKDCFVSGLRSTVGKPDIDVGMTKKYAAWSVDSMRNYYESQNWGRDACFRYDANTAGLGLAKALVVELALGEFSSESNKIVDIATYEQNRDARLVPKPF